MLKTLSNFITSCFILMIGIYLSVAIYGDISTVVYDGEIGFSWMLRMFSRISFIVLFIWIIRKDKMEN